MVSINNQLHALHGRRRRTSPDAATHIDQVRASVCMCGPQATASAPHACPVR